MVESSGSSCQPRLVVLDCFHLETKASGNSVGSGGVTTKWKTDPQLRVRSKKGAACKEKKIPREKVGQKEADDDCMQGSSG